MYFVNVNLQKKLYKHTKDSNNFFFGNKTGR